MVCYCKAADNTISISKIDVDGFHGTLLLI